MRKLKFDEIVFGGDTKQNVRLENSLTKKSGELLLTPIRSTISKTNTMESVRNHPSSPRMPDSPVRIYDGTLNTKSGTSVLPDISLTSPRLGV